MPDASEAYIDRILQTRGSRRVAHATHFYPWHFYKTNKMVRRYPWAEPTRPVRQFDVALTTRMSPEQRVTQRHMKHIDDVCSKNMYIAQWIRDQILQRKALQAACKAWHQQRFSHLLAAAPPLTGRNSNPAQPSLRTRVQSDR